jgi:O-antigen ligase
MVGEQRWLRAYGFTQHPNLLGGLLMASLLAIGGYYLGRSGGRRALLLVALGLGMATLLLTFSRAAWLGAVAGGLTLVGVIVWARWRGQRLAVRSSVVSLTIVVIVVLLTFVAIYWPLLQPRLGLVSQGVEIRSVDARVMQIKASWTLIRMRPLLGVGLGNFPTALYRLAPETMAAYPVFEPVHNVALLSTAELGVLGGALWLCLLFSPWHALWLRRREMRLNPWWAGLSAALAGLTVVSFLDAYVWSSHQGRLMLWLVWGLWAREWVNSRAAPSEKEPIPTRVE